MSHSKIQICNIALATVGADAIRSFDESNKRARQCDVFYESLKDYLITRFDWPFARKFQKLQQLSIDSDELPFGTYAYALPSDCLAPRDIWPLGSRDAWEIFGTQLLTEVEAVGLYYTAEISDSTQFSESFSNCLAMGLAVRLCPSITQNERLTRELYRQYQLTEREAWEHDANIGNSYRSYNENPINDPFVDPDAVITSEQVFSGS